jgi:N6-L-threonylcarbamoyladenine synthase
MLILGIESSCDETSVAILEDNRVLINLIASQLLHQEYGGVVPEYASREHLRLIQGLVTHALEQTRVDLKQIDGIAVTYGPGLMGALLVGLSFAKGLAYALGKPLLAVNHIEGHIMANFLDHATLDFPFLCLLVSGGHTQVVYVREYADYVVLGRSVDDAAGEAFDKAARILNLGYPGGPVIDRIARSGKPDFYHFTRATVKGHAYDFSFSGLKTALLYLVKEKGQTWAQEHLADLCASYQEAVVDMLCQNTFQVIQEKRLKTLVLAGGVAANSRLRQVFNEQAAKLKVDLYFPSLEFCTDNAAMIARTGLELYSRQSFASFKIAAVPNLALTSHS